MLAARVSALVALRRASRRDRRVAMVLFNFPPNAGAAGTAAYLAVFASLHNTLTAMRDNGYTVDVPETVDALRDRLLVGNAERFGTDANVAARISAEDHVRGQPWLDEIERSWGAGARPRAVRRRQHIRAGRAFRQRVRRPATRLRLRGRPDAPAVRAGLRADPRLHRVLPLDPG